MHIYTNTWTIGCSFQYFGPKSSVILFKIRKIKCTFCLYHNMDSRQILQVVLLRKILCLHHFFYPTMPRKNQIEKTCFIFFFFQKISNTWHFLNKKWRYLQTEKLDWLHASIIFHNLNKLWEIYILSEK